MSSLPPPAAAPPDTPRRSPTGRYRVAPAWRGPVTTGVLALVGTAALAAGNPNITHVPLCPLHALTGLDCPFCGCLRAVHALTRADVGAALDHNLLFTVAVPFLVVGWIRWLAGALGRPVGDRWRLPSLATPTLLVVALAFGVARNVPAFAWLGSGV